MVKILSDCLPVWTMCLEAFTEAPSSTLSDPYTGRCLCNPFICWCVSISRNIKVSWCVNDFISILYDATYLSTACRVLVSFCRAFDRTLKGCEDIAIEYYLWVTCVYKEYVCVYVLHMYLYIVSSHIMRIGRSNINYLEFYFGYTYFWSIAYDIN